jgi:hypothetical protein
MTSDRFILCSARNGAAGEYPMRAMDGGEGGMIELDKVAPTNESKLDLSAAMSMRPIAAGQKDTVWVSACLKSRICVSS